VIATDDMVKGVRWSGRVQTLYVVNAWKMHRFVCISAAGASDFCCESCPSHHPAVSAFLLKCIPTLLPSCVTNCVLCCCYACVLRYHDKRAGPNRCVVHLTRNLLIAQQENLRTVHWPLTLESAAITHIGCCCHISVAQAQSYPLKVLLPCRTQRHCGTVCPAVQWTPQSASTTPSSVGCC
jgi:hypothetical protein